jgi:NADH-quinone oxidoreductase subunit M
MSMTPLGAQVLFPLLATLAVIGIIYGALVALAQTDIKRLVAYSSVSHMGFIVLGMLAMNSTGMSGSVIQMVNHGVTTGALFACVGVIYERYHTRQMADFGGLWERMPLFAFFLILTSLGSAAVPGLNGFVGEFPILTGAFSRSPRAAALGATGMILGAWYLLWMVQRVVFGPLREPHAHEPGHGVGQGSSPASHHAEVRPVGWHEVAGLTPLMVMIVLIGVLPAPFFNRIRPSAAAVALRFQSMDDADTLEQMRESIPARLRGPRDARPPASKKAAPAPAPGPAGPPRPSAALERPSTEGPRTQVASKGLR